MSLSSELSTPNCNKIGKLSTEGGEESSSGEWERMQTADVRDLAMGMMSEDAELVRSFECVVPAACVAMCLAIGMSMQVLSSFF